MNAIARRETLVLPSMEPSNFVPSPIDPHLAWQAEYNRLDAADAALTDAMDAVIAAHPEAGEAPKVQIGTVRPSNAPIYAYSEKQILEECNKHQAAREFLVGAGPDTLDMLQGRLVAEFREKTAIYEAVRERLGIVDMEQRCSEIGAQLRDLCEKICATPARAAGAIGAQVLMLARCLDGEPNAETRQAIGTIDQGLQCLGAALSGRRLSACPDDIVRYAQEREELLTAREAASKLADEDPDQQARDAAEALFSKLSDQADIRERQICATEARSPAGLLAQLALLAENPPDDFNRHLIARITEGVRNVARLADGLDVSTAEIAGERELLERYRFWLHIETLRVGRALYPEMGDKSDRAIPMADFVETEWGDLDGNAQRVLAVLGIPIGPGPMFARNHRETAA